ncbi:flagellar basal body rod C-terminal domain-containing protein [Acinetobacter baumannii]|uniref:flagellar basal body rod C-terminal domain-containing protein n=1 Tax=Acinetobacter baumannii TaxID=470 RepID=UPI003917662A
MLSQATANRESVSGVNLDEEAANLIKFQQYYTAAAQVIKAAQQMFDTIINTL